MHTLLKAIRLPSRLLLIAALLGLTACSDIGYIAQCVTGHLNVMSSCRPIDDVLRDNKIPASERKQLEKVLAIREFAVKELNLPDNGSYKEYADIESPFVVWNIVATPEFSFSPKQWCYPVVGCISYRGYYDVDTAKLKAEELKAEGYDVDMYGVKAYSTLKWFKDPVLNTFLNGSNNQLAGLIFHELAHQVVYVANDSSFNEAFAKTVEKEGLRRWLQRNANNQEWQRYLDLEQNGKEFILLLSKAREELSTLYKQPLLETEMRARKKRIFEQLADELHLKKTKWVNPKAVDKWLERGLNNARLTSIATYHDRVPYFQDILDELGGNLPAFYKEVERLANLPHKERIARFEEYKIKQANEFCCSEGTKND